MSPDGEPIDANLSLLLTDIATRGVKIWAEGGRIHFHPRSLLTESELSALRQRKPEVLDLLAIQHHPTFEDHALPSRFQDRRGPLSFQQQWLWRLRAQSRWHFPMGFALRIKSSVDIESLRASCQALLERHESLRTKITVVEGVPCQEVTPIAVTQELEVVEIPAAGIATRDDEVRCLVENLDSSHLDPQVDPVFRATLINLGPADHVLSVVLDHLVADGFSVAILLRDLWLEYMRRASGSVLPMKSRSETVIQYIDYASWQHATDRSWQEHHGRYWATRLEGAQRVHPPHEIVDPDSEAGNSASVPVDFGATVANGLRAEAAGLGATLPLLILAMYAIVLSRWCRQNDFVVPFNAVGRHIPELNNTIGYFAHVLHLRIQLEDTDTVRDVLQRVMREYYVASEHHDFARIVAARPEFIKGTWFQFDPSFPIGDPNVRNDETDWLDAHVRIEPFAFQRTVPVAKSDMDIVLYLAESPTGISGTCSYRTDLFKRQTVQRFIDRLLALAARFLNERQVHVATVTM